MVIIFYERWVWAKDGSKQKEIKQFLLKVFFQRVDT